MIRRQSATRKLTGICLMMAILSVPAAHAGTRDSGGGTGIMVGTRLVVLDLVEAGLENKAVIPAVTPKESIVAQLRTSLGLPEPLKSQVLMPLAAKLTEVDQAAHPAGITMAAAFGLYTFRAVNYKLTSVDDVDSAIGETKIQLAVRKGPSIFINVPNWNLLDDVNRVALLMHEIVYAFQPLPLGCSEVQTGTILLPRTELSCNGQVDSILATSSKARYLNAYFFRPNWAATWQSRLAHELNNDGFSFSALYDLMAGYVDSKNHIVRYDLKDDTLSPIFSRLKVNAFTHETYISSGASLAELAKLCVLGEHPEPQSDWFGRPAGDDFSTRMMISQGHPNVFARSFELNFALDVISVSSGLGFEGVMINSLPQFRSQCLADLRKAKKEVLN